MRLAVTIVFLSSLAISACGDPGSTSGVTDDATTSELSDGVADSTPADATTADTDTAPDTSAPETTPPADATPEQDTTPAEDTAPPQDTAPPEDTTPPEDTAPPQDTTPTDTSVACDDCLDPGAGPTGITITNDSSSTPPQLGGLGNSAAMSGSYELDSITVYTKGAFDGFLVSGATVEDNGQTSGTVEFDGELWGFFLDLDLTFTAQTLLGEQAGASRNMIGGGGCYTISGRNILSDTSTCAEGWPDGTEPPESVEFAHDDASGLFTLKIVLDKEFVLALVPEEYQSIASGAIVGPITFIAKLYAP
jgi:hypothetical protein